MKLKSKKYILGLVVIFAFIFAVAVFYFDNGNKKEEENINESIPIAMALDDGYIYPTIVAITSMMENKKSDTVYKYYIMHPKEFQEDNKHKLQSLSQKYDKCEINLIDMGEEYKDANNKGHITTPTYYRLSLPKILPNVDKLIWIDGDTLTLDDLNEMYNIDMGNLYCSGFLDSNINGTEIFGVENDHCICAGVMLLNLAELRKDDMYNKFKDFIEENNDKLVQHDQTVINVLCADKMGILPAKFGIFNFYDTRAEIVDFQHSLKAENKYSVQELLEARNNPVILHCVSKPWKNSDAFRFDWWVKYAKMTDYYEEMQKEYYSVL